LEEEDLTDDEDKKPAAKVVRKSTDEHDEDKKPAAKVVRTSAEDDREETGMASDKTETGLDVITLPYGMQPLEDKTDVPGTVAAHFLAVARKLYGTNEEASVKKFGDIAATLRDEAVALDFALAPDTAGQTFLARLRSNPHFSVLQGLQRWPAGATSVLDDRVVAFEGKIDDDEEEPAMFQFRGHEDELFRLECLEEIAPRMFSAFYHGQDLQGNFCRDAKFFDEARQVEDGLWMPRLTAIPARWARLFLDNPDMGTTYRRVEELIRGVAPAQRHQFEMLFRGVASACLMNNDKDEAAMSTDWKQIARSKQARAVITKLWARTQPNELAVENQRKQPPIQCPDTSFEGLFADGRPARSISIAVRAAAAKGRAAISEAAARGWTRVTTLQLGGSGPAVKHRQPHPPRGGLHV
jgi:hypothetical protein